MAIIIIYGLNVWWEVTGEELEEDALTVQLYSKQFDWTARYAGEDGQLGPSSFNFISGSNPLGIINTEVYDQMIADIDMQVAMEKESIANEILPDNVLEEKQDKIERLKRHKLRVLGFERENSNYTFGNDDIVMDKGVFYVPKGREVSFQINSRDVIHSAYIPHFRMQMNAVPGMTTSFKIKPTITTAEMRRELEDEEFDYILLCNKICGAAHYNMQMTVKVVEENEFQEWLSQQKTFVQPDAPEAEVVAEVTTGK
jgi:cytochrome c oxidase subunit 2